MPEQSLTQQMRLAIAAYPGRRARYAELAAEPDAVRAACNRAMDEVRRRMCGHAGTP